MFKRKTAKSILIRTAAVFCIGSFPFVQGADYIARSMAAGDFIWLYPKVLDSSPLLMGNDVFR